MSRELYAQYQREAAEDRETYGHPRARVRFWSKTLELWGPCGDFRDLRFTDKKLSAGGLTIRVPDNEHWRSISSSSPGTRCGRSPSTFPGIGRSG
ncbi:hypothetical protein GS485_17460 [Rhodococcus hoagii]|nr:hypothetical protein [Prescottella equi]